MGKNPSYFERNPAEGELQEKRPVERVSYFDAIYFCNKLSTMFGLVPVYSVDGITDVTKWYYKPHNGSDMWGKLEQNLNANGYRLPTVEEWQYAALAAEDFNCYDKDEKAWYEKNSNFITHEVGKKKANGYGLFDMSGNVCEWCWESDNSNFRHYLGGSWSDYVFNDIVTKDFCYAKSQRNNIGFRIVCSAE